MRRGGGAGGAASMGSSMTAASFIGRNDHSASTLTRHWPLLQPRTDNICDPRAGAAVAERKDRAAHRGKRDRIVEQTADFCDDLLAVRADQSRRSRCDALRPLGFVAQHQQRNAERWGLLLHAARIAQHQVRIAHPLKQLILAAWGKEANAANTGEELPHARGDEGVWVEYEIDFGALYRKLEQRARDRG